jgi:hypothetical protein
VKTGESQLRNGGNLTDIFSRELMPNLNSRSNEEEGTRRDGSTTSGEMDRAGLVNK